MNLFQLIKPQLQVKHFQTSEAVGEKVINHEFICFEAVNADISSVFAARMLAKRMGRVVLPLLKKLATNTQNAEQAEQIARTRAWVEKKAVWHPALVEKCTLKALKNMQCKSTLCAVPLAAKKIYVDAAIVAILHDIGRLSEVDVAQGLVCMKRSGLNKNHAAISFDVLQHAKIKPEILLAIKYHEFAGVAEAKNDDIYAALQPDNKKIAEFYVCLLQDMDKTANLLERSEFGIQKCAEFFDPHYVQDYNLTNEYWQKALNGEYLNIKGGHLLDAMVRFVTWTYSIHFEETKEILSGILTQFFKQMYREAWREYNNDENKNARQLADTLVKICKLEDYAIAVRMNMPINNKNREEIKKQITELQSKA